MTRYHCYPHAEFTDRLRDFVGLFTLDETIKLHFECDPRFHLGLTPETFIAAVNERKLSDEDAQLLLAQGPIKAYTASRNAPRTAAGQAALAYLQHFSDAVVVTPGEPDPPGALVLATSGDTETKSERFRRLAPPRVSRALKAIALVGNLGDRSNYECTLAESQAIVRALRSELDAVTARLTSGRKPPRSFEFKL